MVMKIWPDMTPDHVICIICSSTIHIESATVGELYKDGTQAFACATHLTNRSERLRWFTAWAIFVAKQNALTDLIT
jgi:hypothetical protein